MRTRRDQVQAYRFVTRRIVSALLSGDPETSDLPMRRLGMAVFGSVIAAAVVLGGVGAYGQFTGNAAPLEANTLVIERETGATYVFAEGKLHPTLNYASARLALDTADPEERTMSRASLKDRPRGTAVGIVGAPDDLPDPDALVRFPWSVCDVPDPADPQRSTTRLVLDTPLPGGTPLSDRAVLVRVNGTRYLLTAGRQLRVAGDEQALVALKMAGAPTATVGQQLLNAVPVGPELRKPSIEGYGGSSGVSVGDRPARIGQVFRAADQYYVLTRRGLAPVKEMTALLLLGDGGQITDITPDQAGQLLTDQRLDADGLPQRLPALHEVRAGRSVLCVTYRSAGADQPPTTTLEVFDQPPAELTGTRGVAARQGGRDAVATAESVLLPGGKGVLAQAGAGESGRAAAGSTVYLITPQGVRYPLGPNAQIALGYGGVTPLAVPASLLALVPTGPTLVKDDAMAQFDPGARAGGAGPSAPAPAGSAAAQGG
ncbi:type VII secretion protein EccB [Micromonospora auratinigra]|uniref:Type VII secretion protein EccB n=1 Tax=Micromonospora auratinigra TaxID=261654 RepID=A0A1A9A4Z2_9ACTN|nr:type VII secretion protein EccB [Micromonospora auratinigra]SBT51273.1 type VII secretion protein EccB [Micromonospora auratinigra]